MLCCALLGLGGTGAAAALDGEVPISQLAHEFWQTRDGLPQDSIYAVAETPDGYTWFGTAAGLVRFDGVKFTVFDRANTPGLVNHHVNALVVDPGGCLWIGTNGAGLVRYEAGHFTRYDEAEGLPESRVMVLAAGRDGSIWAGTYGGGLARFQNGSFEVYTRAEGLLDMSVFALLEDSRGRLWIGTLPGGVNVLENGRLWALTAADGLPSNLVRAFAESPDGSIWIGTSEGLARWRDGRLEVPHGGFAESAVSALAMDDDGCLWMGTYGAGLGRLYEGEISSFTSRQGLTADTLGSLYIDSHGSLWAGTTGGGVNRLREGPIRTFGRPEGVSAEVVISVHEDRRGRVLLGTFGGGLDRIEENGEIRRLTHLSERFPFIQALGSDTQGRFWISSAQGVHRLGDDGFLKSFTPADGLGHETVFAILATRNGDVWLATNGGLTRHRDGRLENFTTQDGLAGNLIRALYEDRRGRLWIGTTNGASVYDGGAFTSWDMDDGLTSNNVWAFHEDAEGDIWLGTNGGGLDLFEDGEILSVTMQDGLPDDNLCSIFEDARGWMWISSSKGIFRVARHELESYVAGRSESFAALLYSTADGLRNGVCFSSHGREIDGKFWFPTFEGVAVVDPVAAAGIGLPPPRVVLERLVIDGVDHEPGDVPSIAPGARNIEIHYTALGTPEPRRVRFRYRLEADGEWQSVGPRRIAYFSHLPPGSYRFRVEASREDGTWGSEGAEMSLVVRPAFWQTWPFYLLSFSFMTGLAWSWHRLRMARLERYNQKLRRMKGEVEAKNAEVEAKNAEVGAKNAELAAKNTELERFTYTVSHDLKSPLFTIQGFLGLLEKDLAKGDEGRLRADTAQIRDAAATMSRQLDDLLELSRIGRVVNPSSEIALGALAQEAVDLLAGRIRELGAEVTVTAEMPRVWADRPRLLEVMQNLIENALRYRRPEVTPRVEISARRDGDEVICAVTDNGIGIEPSHQQKIFELFAQLDPSGEGTGIGLAIVERIITFHGGRVWVESEGRDRGASFCFSLPTRRGEGVVSSPGRRS